MTLMYWSLKRFNVELLGRCALITLLNHLIESGKSYRIEGSIYYYTMHAIHHNTALEITNYYKEMQSSTRNSHHLRIIPHLTSVQFLSYTGYVE